MSDFLGIAQKVRLFLILVPKTDMIFCQKLLGKSMEPNAASFVVISIWQILQDWKGFQSYAVGVAVLKRKKSPIKVMCT